MTRILLTSFFLATVLAGCSKQQTRSPRPSDVVVIGIDPSHPPFAVLDSVSGALDGFDVELLSTVCTANRWRCEFRPIARENLREALMRSDIDIAVGEFPDVSEEEGHIIRSDPYYLTGVVLIVPSGQPLTADSGQWAGQTVAVSMDIPVGSLQSILTGAKMQTFADPEEAVSELKAGRLAALVTDYTTARKTVETHPDLQIVPGMLTTAYYTAAMRADDTQRMTRFNDALASLLGGYTYEQVHMKWFGYPLLNVAVPDSVAARWGKH
jgi:ABC-type amino acid transport substrate-binding protein